MSYHISAFVMMIYTLLSIAFVAIAAHRYMIFLIPFVFAMCIILINEALPAIKETGRLFRLAKSPMLSHVQNSLSGSSTIRVYGRNQEFIETNYNHINNHIFAIQVYEGVNSWFAIRIDILSILLMAVISTACVFLRTDVSVEEQQSISLSGLTDSKEVIEPVLLSMLLSYVLTIQTTLVYVLKFYV